MKIKFRPNGVSAKQAIEIVRGGLQDPIIHHETKVMAIQKVAEMETHNSIKKDELVAALRWLFERYEFGEE